MPRTMAFASLVLLTACASQAEKTAARDAWSDCVAQAVKRLDDGKTDPVSIAYGVAPQCASLYNHLSEMMIRENITDAGQANMQTQMRAGEIPLITNAILNYRASASKRTPDDETRGPGFTSR
jgi:hypothetical protein